MLEVTQAFRAGVQWWVLVEDHTRTRGWWGHNKDAYEARADAMRLARKDGELKQVWPI